MAKACELLLVPLLALLVLAIPIRARASVEKRLDGIALDLFHQLVQVQAERDLARAELAREQDQAALDIEEAARALMREKEARKACEARPPHVPTWVIVMGSVGLGLGLAGGAVLLGQAL